MNLQINLQCQAETKLFVFYYYLTVSKYVIIYNIFKWMDKLKGETLLRSCNQKHFVLKNLLYIIKMVANSFSVT